MAPTLRERLNAAWELLYDERDIECVDEMRVLLSDYGLPRYYQIKCRILLACALDDWYEAEIHRTAAEELWTTYRHFWPPGNDPDMDVPMNKLRELLDDLKEAQDQDRPADHFETCGWDVVEGELENATDLAESEDEEATYLSEAEDEVEFDLEESKLERDADFLGGDLSETLYTEDVEALYKKVDSEMTGKKLDSEKSHSQMQGTDDGEGKGQEMVTSGHEEPKAKDEGGKAEPPLSQHEDILAEEKTEEE